MADAAVALAVDADNPWPGLEAFTEGAAAYFHGREDEAAELLERVKSRGLTVLYGQSGLGKTSLLQAGLFPRLRRDGFLPVYVRLDFAAGAPPLGEQMMRQAARTINDATLDATFRLEDETSLWRWLHRRDGDLCDLRGREITPVIVVDQFEEIFTLGSIASDETSGFLAELGDLVENRMPEELEAAVERDPAVAAQYDFDRRAHRVLLSLREDFLPQLEGLKGTLPSLMQNRMRLKRMSGREALSAVLGPGGSLVTGEVATEIVRFVAGDATSELERLEIEPPLLSLVCHELNARRQAAGQPQITAALFAGGRDDILAGFYEDCLAGQSAEVRAFVEDELVTDSGYRESMAVERARKALEQRGASPDAINHLVKGRLLRIEERSGLPRVELTHDVLLPVVCSSRQRRRAREEREALERRQREAEARVDETRRKLRAARRQNLALSGFALAACIAAVMAWIAWRDALVQRAAATTAAKTAEEQREAAERSRRRFYGAQAALSFIAWEKGQIGRARELLDDSEKAAGFDRVGWEWQYVKGLCDVADMGRTVLRAGGDVLGVDALAFLPAQHGQALVVGDYRGLRLLDRQTGREIRQFRWKIEDQVGFVARRQADGGGFVIDAVLNDRLAEAAGLRTGDRIVGVESPEGRQRDARDLSDEDFAALMHGVPGTVLRMSVLRASGGAPQMVQIVRAKKVVRDMGCCGGVTALAVTADGRRMVSAGFDEKRVIVWDTSTGSGIRALEGGAPVTVLAVSPAGDYVAFGSQDDSEFILASVSGPTGPRRLRVGGGPVGGLAFTADGRRVAAVAEDCAAGFWDVRSARLDKAFRITDAVHDKCGYAAIAPQGHWLGVKVGDWVRLIDLSDPTRQRWLSNDQVWSGSFTFSRDGRYLATLGSDGPVLVWDTETGKRMRKLRGHETPAFAAAFSPDAHELATGGADGDILVWDLGVPEPQTKRFRGFAIDWGASGLALSADGRFLAVAEPSREPPVVAVYDAVTGEAIEKLPGKVRRATFSPDGSVLAVPDAQGDIGLYKVPRGGPIRTLPGAGGELSAVEFAPDGGHVVSLSASGAVVLWDTTTGESRELANGAFIEQIAVSPDGRLVAIGSEFGSWLVDAGNGNKVASLDVQGGEFASLSVLRFNPDGSELITGGSDGRLRLYQAPTWRLVTTFTGHTSDVKDVAFSPDSRLVASVSRDRTARVWDLDVGREMFLLGDDAVLQAVAFSPDGFRLITAGNKELRFWDAAVLAGEPTDATPLFHLVRGESLFDLGQWQGAVAAFTRAFDLGAREAWALVKRGEAFAHLERWDEATADFAAAFALSPVDRKAGYFLSLVHLVRGRPAEYEAVRRTLVEQARTLRAPEAINRAVWLSSLSDTLPPDVDLNELVSLQQEAVRANPKAYALASTLGSILYRAGRFDESVDAFTKASALRPPATDAAPGEQRAGSGFDWVGLALAHARAGRLAAAKPWLEVTRALRDRIETDPFYADPHWTWPRWPAVAELDLWIKEMEAVFAHGPAPVVAGAHARRGAADRR